MIKWYQVFSLWLLFSALLLKLKLFFLIVLSLVATVFGQIYISTRGRLNPAFVIVRIILHIIPMVYGSRESSPVHMVGLLTLYTVSLLAQGTDPIKIYKELLLEEPTDMTVTQFVQTRFF